METDVWVSITVSFLRNHGAFHRNGLESEKKFSCIIDEF